MDPLSCFQAKFDLAVSRRQKGEQEADFFHCVSFGRQAEFVEKYFHSGSRVLVVGRVQNNNYTNRNGDKVYGFNVITEDVEFGQKKNSERKAQMEGTGEESPVPEGEMQSRGR